MITISEGNNKSNVIDIFINGIDHLPFESNSFDLIISLTGLSPELQRILKSNGKLLINSAGKVKLTDYSLESFGNFVIY